MRTYEQVLAQLNELRDEQYRIFNEKIVNIPSGTSIGVRVPLLRAYAKKTAKESDFSMDAFLLFPDDVYEIRLLKCLFCGYVPADPERRVSWIRICVSKMQSWAECDLFCSGLKFLRQFREQYFSEIEKFLADGSEFSQRFACVVLLTQYMESEWLPSICSVLERVDSSRYYTYMGAAWLFAEVLIRFYDSGLLWLNNGAISADIKGKAIQKACESYRLDDLKKNYLKNLKKQWKR